MRLKIAIEAPNEIYAGTVMPVKVTVLNIKRFLPSFLIKVKVGDSDILFPVVGTKAEAAGLASIAFPRRGRQSIDNIYVISVFPFNFFVRSRHIDSSLDVIVLPAPRKCSLQSLFTEEKRSRGDRTLDRTGFEAEILSIRDYRYGDPQKYIHWKASARTGTLKTKELSSLSHRPLVLDFDGISIGDLEEKISCIAYVILKSYRQNIPVGLKIGGKIFSPGAESGEAGAGRIAMLKELALYGEK